MPTCTSTTPPPPPRAKPPPPHGRGRRPGLPLPGHDNPLPRSFPRKPRLPPLVSLVGPLRRAEPRARGLPVHVHGLVLAEWPDAWSLHEPVLGWLAPRDVRGPRVGLHPRAGPEPAGARRGSLPGAARGGGGNGNGARGRGRVRRNFWHRATCAGHRVAAGSRLAQRHRSHAEQRLVVCRGPAPSLHRAPHPVATLRAGWRGAGFFLAMASPARRVPHLLIP